jgi:hypothetical protein
MSEISRASGVHRATLNAALHSLFDAHEIAFCIGKLNPTRSRQAYSEAAHRSIAAGRHASQRKRTQKINEEDDMNSYQQVREKFRTLDQACTEIERLQQQIDSRVTTAATTATGPPKQRAPVAIPRTPQKPPPPSISDLSREEIVQCLDAANRSGDQELVGRLYNELQERRR